MTGMFKSADMFNGDLSAWSIDSVTDISWMFAWALSFNQDISGWAVQSVTSMRNMFNGASAFDQDLGWCVDDDVTLADAFLNAPCESTSCGITQGDSCTRRNF